MRPYTEYEILANKFRKMLDKKVKTEGMSVYNLEPMIMWYLAI